MNRERGQPLGGVQNDGGVCRYAIESNFEGYVIPDRQVIGEAGRKTSR